MKDLKLFNHALFIKLTSKFMSSESFVFTFLKAWYMGNSGLIFQSLLQFACCAQLYWLFICEKLLDRLRFWFDNWLEVPFNIILPHAKSTYLLVYSLLDLDGV